MIPPITVMGRECLIRKEYDDVYVHGTCTRGEGIVNPPFPVREIKCKGRPLLYGSGGLFLPIFCCYIFVIFYIVVTVCCMLLYVVSVFVYTPLVGIDI